jgi:hypothetical protein
MHVADPRLQDRGDFPTMATEFEDDLQRRFQQEIAALSTAGSRVAFQLSPAEAWAVLGQLQLALRHPSNAGNAAQIARDVINKIAAELCAPGSASEQIFHMGERGL